MDGDVIKDDSSMCRRDFGREMSLNIFAIFSEFLLSVRKSELDHFDGHIPGTGPLATRLDLFYRFRSSEGDFSMSHMSNVLFRS